MRTYRELVIAAGGACACECECPACLQTDRKGHKLKSAEGTAAVSEAQARLAEVLSTGECRGASGGVVWEEGMHVSTD